MPRTRGEIKKELQTVTSKLMLDPSDEALIRQYAELSVEFGQSCKGLSEFIRVYTKWLKHYRETKPTEYMWDMSEFNTVVGRMFNAIQKGRFNKNSESIKATCKELGIPWTYKGIAEFIK